MKLKLFLIYYLVCFALALEAQTLGNYSATTIVAGRNAVVTPSAIPTSAVRIQITTSATFSGVLTGNPANGKVTITNAKPVGTYLIKVRAINSAGAGVSKTFTLTVNPPDCSLGNYTNANNVNTGLQQVNVVVGDFNNDGKQDLACCHEGGNNTLSIRMGNGNGGFTGTTEVAVGSHPFSVAIGDFNGDGKQDLVVINSGDNAITPLIGNGSGGFTIRPVVDVSWSPISIAVGDFNNDNKQDVVTANLNGSSVSVRYGDGTGGFYGTALFNVGQSPSCVALGDFNTDGKLDLATSNSGDSTVSIRFGNGTGGFTGNTEVPVGLNPNCVAVGDFNSDGNHDLATANYLANTISVRFGNGLGAFTGTTEIPVGSNPYFVAIGHYNGDNNADLATANYFGNNVSIRFGNGVGGFIAGTEINAGSYPMCVASGDFNADRITDLAVSNYNDHNISIRLGLTDSAIVNSVVTNSPICEGQNIHMDALGGIAYSWSGPNGFTSTDQNVIIPLCELSDSGLYSISITDSTTCTATTFAHIIVNALPVVTFSIADDTLCMNDPVQTLMDGTPGGGTISGTGIINVNQFDPGLSGPGQFTIVYTYTDVFDCVNTDSAKIFVFPCDVSVNDLSTSGYLNVYPNPVTNFFNVDLPKGSENNILSIYTPAGKLVRKWSFSNDRVPLFSTDGLAEGFYVLKLVSEHGTMVSRIIKN